MKKELTKPQHKTNLEILIQETQPKTNKNFKTKTTRNEKPLIKQNYANNGKDQAHNEENKQIREHSRPNAQNLEM